MDRREFLTTVGFAALAGSGVAALAQPSQPTQPAPRQRVIKKAVGIGMVEDPAAPTTLEKFQLLRDCGFAGVEINWPCNVPLDEFAAAQAKTGLQIHGLVDSVHWKHTLNHGSPNIRRQGLDALCDCLRAARTLHASSVLLVPGVVNADHPYDDCWRLSIEQIRRAIPVAQETGVTIAVENVWNGFLLSPLEAARYVDELNAGLTGPQPVAFHFDIGNIINAGWPHHWVKILGASGKGGRIAKLHIKDFSRKQRDEQGLWKGFDVELGDGDAQWARVMAALDESGYTQPPPPADTRAAAQGWATAEVRGGDRQRMQQIAAQMDRLFAL